MLAKSISQIIFVQLRKQPSNLPISILISINQNEEQVFQSKLLILPRNPFISTFKKPKTELQQTLVKFRVDLINNLLIFKSMLAVQNSVISKISVHSKKKSQCSKMSPSTHNTQSPPVSSNKNKNNSLAYQNYWDQSQESKRVVDLHKKIEEMEKQELQMEAKFQQCIQSMLAQIERNNDCNARLATEVNHLKHELTQSKKDILIIEEYIKLNLNKEVKTREMNDPSKVGRPSSGRNQLLSSSSSKNLLLRRSPSKIFRSKLLFKQ